MHASFRPAAEFKIGVSDARPGGNRFDSTPDDPFPYLYVAARARTALMETLVRSVPFNDEGQRSIPRTAIHYRSITAIEAMTDLTLISLLSTESLARACQDEWLTQAPPADYQQTRRWARWLRSHAAWAQGMIWPSARDLGSRSLVLFGDRMPGPALRVVPGTTVDLASVHGTAWLNSQLAPYRISADSALTPARLENRACARE